MNRTLKTDTAKQVVGLTMALGQGFAKVDEPITANCVCPGVVRTNIMPAALVDATPEEFRTPIATVVKAVLGFIDDDKLQGKVAECSGENIYFVGTKGYPDQATEYVYSDKTRGRVDGALLMKQMTEMRATLSRNLGEGKQ